jgi:hypothetical protein
MSVENKQVRGDASVSRNVNAGGNAVVRGNAHIGHNLRVDGTVEARNIKGANKGLFLDEAQLRARYPHPEDGWYAGVGSSSPFAVYIARDGEWVRTNGTFEFDVDMDAYDQRIESLEDIIAELVEIINHGGSAEVVTVGVSVAEGSTGRGAVSGGGMRRSGTEVTVTATANAGYRFVEWLNGDGEHVSTDAAYTFTATENVTLTAVFEVRYYHLAVEVNNSSWGVVSVNPAVPAEQDGYNYNTPVMLTAAANGLAVPQAYFVRWSDGETSLHRTVIMNEDITLEAIFAQVEEIIVESGTGGSTTITVMRGSQAVDLAADGVRIGDIVTLTATGVTNKPSAWKDGQGNAIEDGEVYALDTSADEITMTCTFTYKDGMPLAYMAEFNGAKITTELTIGVHSYPGTTAGTAVIQQNGTTIAEEEAIEIADGSNIVLVASAKEGWKFAGWWKGGEEIQGATQSYGITVSADTAGTYTAKFERSGAPDFYYGAVVPDGTSGNAYDKANVISELTKGWIDGNTVNTPEITIASGRKFIVLYNSEKVTPTYMKLGEDLSDPDKYEEFDSTGINNPRNFNQGVVAETYTSFEGKVTVATGDVQYFQVTFTKQ